jgi:hypothetical protein
MTLMVNASTLDSLLKSAAADQVLNRLLYPRGTHIPRGRPTTINKPPKTLIYSL